MTDDLRQRYAEALASTNTLDEIDLEFTLRLVLGIHEEEVSKLREERDLAIAHDRQPYPTAWAYEQACKALHVQRERAERAEAEIIALTDHGLRWRERAETAEAAIARVRELANRLGIPDPGLGDEILAALDDTEADRG